MANSSTRKRPHYTFRNQICNECGPCERRAYSTSPLYIVQLMLSNQRPNLLFTNFFKLSAPVARLSTSCLMSWTSSSSPAPARERRVSKSALRPSPRHWAGAKLLLRLRPSTPTVFSSRIRYGPAGSNTSGSMDGSAKDSLAAKAPSFSAVRRVYETWVSSNAGLVSAAEESVRSILLLLPGRFSESELSSESGEGRSRLSGARLNCCLLQSIL